MLRLRSLVAFGLILLLADILVVNCSHSHRGSIGHRRRHTDHRRHFVGQEIARTRWRRGRSRGKHHHRRHRHQDDDDVVVRETDKMAAEAINQLFGPRPFAVGSSLHAPAKTDKKKPVATGGGSHKHRHRGHHHKTISSEKNFMLELPVGCEAEPCQHDGDCYSDPSSPLGYACRCQPGFTGDFCEIDTYCSNEPCKNDGICTSEGSDPRTRKYSCKCVNGFTGKNCEISPLTPDDAESKEGVQGFISNLASTRNPVVWPMLAVAILALLLTTFIACCICVELRRDSLIKSYKLYKVVGLEKEFPMTSSVRLACKMTKRWLRCRCLKSSDDQLLQLQPYAFRPAAFNTPIDGFSAHNNAELPMLSAQASEDSFWSQTASQEQAQELKELQQLRSLQQMQLMQQTVPYEALQPADNQTAVQLPQPQLQMQ